MEVPAVPKIICDDIKVPMCLRSAITKILKFYNRKNTIKPEDIEEMEKSGLLNELKSEG